jgi:hypothetical protein
MSVKTRKVTKAQAEKVLAEVAIYLGKQGLGTPVCPQGQPLTSYLDHPDGSLCKDATFGPAPTGKDAMYRGEGPMLDMAWEPWSGGPRPTILLEGGPYEWPITGSYEIQQALDAKGVAVFVEPINGYALGIYPA